MDSPVAALAADMRDLIDLEGLCDHMMISDHGVKKTDPRTTAPGFRDMQNGGKKCGTAPPPIRVQGFDRFYGGREQGGKKKGSSY